MNTALKDGHHQLAAMFQALFNSKSQGIIGVDREGAIRLVNETAADLFGYAREELVGQTIEALVPERVRAIHGEERSEYFACPRSRPMGIGVDLKGRRRDGSEFPVEISLNHLDVGGDVVTICLITDITERTRLEAHVRQT